MPREKRLELPNGSIIAFSLHNDPDPYRGTEPAQDDLFERHIDPKVYLSPPVTGNFHVDAISARTAHVGLKMPDRHKAIYALLKIRGPKGATGIEIRNHLESLGMGSADVARDVRELHRRYGVPREWIRCEYVGKSSAGSMIHKWILTEKP